MICSQCGCEPGSDPGNCAECLDHVIDVDAAREERLRSIEYDRQEELGMDRKRVLE